MLTWVVGFILLDIVVTLAVVAFVVKRRDSNGALMVGGLNIGAIRDYTDAIHPRIGEYVRSNWSGAPDQLPLVLENMLAEMDREARTHGLELDRDTLKKLLRASLASHKVAPGKNLDEALAHVA